MSLTPNHSMQDWGVALDCLIDTTDAIDGFCTLLTAAIELDGGSLKSNSCGISTLLSRQVNNLKMIEPFLRQEIKRIGAEKLHVSDADAIARLTGTKRQTVERVIVMATGIDLSTTREKGAFEAEGGAARQVFDTVVSKTLAVDGFMDLVAEVSDLPVEPLRRAFSAAMFIEKSDLNRKDRTEYVAGLKASVDSMTMRDQAEEATPDHGKETPREKRDQMIAELSNDGMDPADIAQAVNLKRSTVERVIGRLKAASEKSETMPEDKAVNE